MTQLYTVRMNREVISCKYDADTGHRVSEERKVIPYVMGDLPHCTAVMYQRQFPDAGVVIEPQAMTNERSSDRRGIGTGYRPSKSIEEWLAPSEPKTKKPETDLVGAAMSGDLSKALSE
jgi:hypothetical protein